MQGLTDRSRRPYRYANQLPFQVENFILNVKHEHPSRGARKIRERLKESLVGEFRPLQNHSCFLKIQPWIARVELAWVSITQVAEKIHLPLAVRKECRI